MLEDAFNAVPADAACERCRHFSVDPRSGRCYCEYRDRRVEPKGWCGDFELVILEAIKHRARVEKS